MVWEVRVRLDVLPRSLLLGGRHSWVAGLAHLYLPATSFRDDTLSPKQSSSCSLMEFVGRTLEASMKTFTQSCYLESAPLVRELLVFCLIWL